MANTNIQAQVAQLDELAKKLGLVSYTKLASALCDVLEGEQDHDINPCQTGLSQEDCDAVIQVRSEARKALYNGKGRALRCSER